MALRITQSLFYALSLTPLLVWKGLFYEYTTTEAFFIMAVVELLFVSFVWAMYQDSHVRPTCGLGEKALLAFVVVLVIASLFGVDSMVSFWSSFDRLTGVVFWIHLVILFVVGRAVLRTQQEWQNLFFSSTAVGFMVASLHLFSFSGLEGAWFIERYASIANSTFFAVYLLFQLVFCALLFILGGRKSKTYASIAGATILLGILTSEAQAVIISMLGGFLLCAAILGMVRVGKARLAGFLIVAVLSIAFVVGLLGLFQPSSVVRDWFAEYSSGARFALWDIAWQGIKERPILGWGLENFQTVFLKYYNPCFGSAECGFENLHNRAHSKPLDLLIETGFVGLIAYSSIFVAAFWTLWRHRQKSRDAIIPAVLTGGLAAFFVQNLVGLDMPITLLFWVLLLVYFEYASDAHRETKKQPRPTPVWLALVVSLCIPVLFFFTIVQPLRANASVAQWFLAQNDDGRLAALDRATSLSPVGRDQRLVYMARQVSGGTWITNIRGEVQRPTVQEELAMLAERLSRSMQDNPEPLPLALNLGLVYHTEGKFFDPDAYQDAVKIFESAIDAHPSNPQPLWALAAVFVDQGNGEHALALTQQALNLDRDVLESHYQRLIVAKFFGDKGLIDAYAKEIKAAVPSSEAYVNLVLQSDIEQKRTQLLFELY